MESEATPASPEQAAVTHMQVRSEIQDYVRVRQQRRRLFPRAALVGLLAGLVATAFRAALDMGDNVRTSVIVWAHHYPYVGWILPVIGCALGALCGVFLVRRYAPETSGSGIPHLEAVLHRYRELHWKRVMAVKFVGGSFALGAGLLLGREGPTVQMGGAAGDAVSQLLKVSARDRLTLIASGAGAGLAAAFNAPLAGVMFVLEEIQKDFRQAVFGSAFIAAVVADIVARSASGQLPVFRIPSFPVSDLSALPAFAVLGIVAGLLGVVYNRTLMATLNLFAKIPQRLSLLSAACVGGTVGMVAWFSPGAVGGGHHLSEYFLAGHLALAVVPAWFLLRFVLSIASYATGAPGGIFAPLLVLGALIGLATGLITHMLAPRIAPIPAVFAVVGMAAYFTAIVRAPLTGIVLIMEMTASYAQMLPLLVACFCAYVVSEASGVLPIYESLLERDLMRDGVHRDPKEPLVLEFEIEPGAPFDGCEVRQLGLPPGCILVSCRDEEHEHVPTATMRLEAHNRITAMIDPAASGAIEVLRNGCEAAD